MEFLKPNASVRRLTPVKAKSNKISKLSLKYRQKTAESCKENNNQALPSKDKYLPKVAKLHSGKDLFASLISSDESNGEDKLLDNSTLFDGSQMHFPNAESTRLEVSVRLSKESNPGSYFSCRSQLTPPTGCSSDGEECEGACEESIIYVSDDETLPPPKPKSFLNIVIPESESDSTEDKAKQGQHHSENEEIIVLDSSDDTSFFRQRQLDGKAVLSKLNELAGSKQKWRNIIIPPSSDSSDSDDIVDTSVHAPNLVQKNRTSVNSPAPRESPAKKTSYTPVKRVIIPESEEESPVQEDEVSPRTLAAEKLSETKVDYIQRWIDNHDSESGSESRSNSGNSRTSPVKSANRQADGLSSSNDSFDELIRRENKPKKRPPKSSFLVDSSSSDDSFSNYRKVLTKDIREDVQNTDRTPFRVLTAKPTPQYRRRRDIFSDSSSESESDAESSCSSEWDPEFSKDRVRGRQPPRKPAKPQKKQPIPDSRSPFKKPGDTLRPSKKSVDDTPKTLKKPVDTPRTLKKPVDTPRTLKKSEDTPRPLKKPDDTPRTLKKLVESTARPMKKLESDTPRPSKTPADGSSRPLKKPTEGVFGTPANTPKASKRGGKIGELQKTATPYSPIRTFLTSLEGPAADPNLRNHPEASIYFKNYKSKREELARRLFKLFNREVFDSRLPDDLVLEWSGRLLSTAGSCSCKLIRKPEGSIRTARIVLSSKILDSADRLRDTLIHELCHAAVWLLNEISGGHGPFWKAWARKAERRFPELPKISVCHAYSIETKFTYKCKNCGYSFGRHSKSINLETQRCGHCYGIFELLVNKGRSQGGSATPAPSKPPTGFALFVKENYGSMKKDHSDKKHGDIMKLLGQKFAQAKIAQ